MSNDLNLCLFTGRLGKDVELRYTQSGTAVASISIAVNGRKKNGDQWEDTTEWVPVVLWGKLGETAGRFLSKGSRIRITGRYQTRKWQDQNGQDRYTTEIVASEMQMLDGKSGSGDSGGSGAESTSASPGARPGVPGNPSQPSPAGNDDFDDIPF